MLDVFPQGLQAVKMSSVLILGATGFIGGALVFRIKQENPELQVTALVRNPADAKALKGSCHDCCKEQTSYA